MFGLPYRYFGYDQKIGLCLVTNIFAVHFSSQCLPTHGQVKPRAETFGREILGSNQTYYPLVGSKGFIFVVGGILCRMHGVVISNVD